MHSELVKHREEAAIVLYQFCQGDDSFDLVEIPFENILVEIVNRIS